MIFDTHAHYDSSQFDPDREELLASMAEQGVGTIVNVSASYESCFAVPEMAQQYPFMYAAVGVHPDEAGDLDEEAFSRLEAQLGQEKVVAVGEIGLDYYWDKESHEVQKKWFARQLQLADKWKLPVLIHSREAAADTMEMIRAYGTGLSGVIHCYSYSREMAEEYVKMGYYIGIGGVVTFKNARKLKEVAAEIPLTSILLETDCPYLAPVPYRGKRNHSGYLRYVAEEIARIKEISPEEVIRQTEENAKRMYGLA